MKHLTIYRRYFTESDCFNSGTKQTSVGVQVHSTGANNPNLCRYVGPDDGRLGKNKYNNTHNRPGTDVCASAYIGKLQDGTVAVYQALPWDVRCWLSGKGSNGNANRIGYVGFEICEDGLKNEAYFMKAVMEAAVLLTAHLCTMFGTTPHSVVKSYSQGDALAVMDHRELHSVQLASNHGDIRNWLSNFGKTMDDFRDAVAAAMQEGVEVTYIDCDDPASGDDPEETVQFIAKAVNPGSYLNIRVNKSKKSNSIGIIIRGETAEVLNASDSDWWKVKHDGVVGYCMTHSGNDRYLEAVIDTSGEEKKSYTVHITGLDYESATELLEAHPGQATMEEG